MKWRLSELSSTSSDSCSYLARSNSISQHEANIRVVRNVNIGWPSLFLAVDSAAEIVVLHER